MPVTPQMLANAANAAIEFHMDRGRVFDQSIQMKPLLKRMAAKAKSFPGGKDNITLRVVGDYTTTIMGYNYDDQVTYQNPTNIKTLTFPWKEIHAGISMTMTELKTDGIHVVDSMDGKSTTQASQREMTALASILENKIEDMSEGWARGANEMLWRDGTQDSKQVPGLLSFILPDPTTATIVAGVDQSANSWWRNRASLAINAATASNQNLTNTLETEFLQLRRYGGMPNAFLCGSDFIEAYQKELRANGSYTQTGFRSSGSTDAGMGEVAFKGVTLEYDPTLDDLGYTKYGFLLDMRTIFPMDMESEGSLTAPKQHNPARPEDKYVLYRALTWTGGMVCRKRNANGIYSIA